MPGRCGLYGFMTKTGVVGVLLHEGLLGIVRLL